jgi:hypothetical protein
MRQRGMRDASLSDGLGVGRGQRRGIRQVEPKRARGIGQAGGHGRRGHGRAVVKHGEARSHLLEALIGVP